VQSLADGQQAAGNSRSYCVTVRSAKNDDDDDDDDDDASN